MYCRGAGRFLWACLQALRGRIMSRLPESEFWFRHFLAGCSWTSCFTTQCLSFLFWKMRRKSLYFPGLLCRVHKLHQGLRQRPAQATSPSFSSCYHLPSRPPWREP